MRRIRILTQSLILLAVILMSANVYAVTLADLNAYIQRAILTAQSQGDSPQQAISKAMATAMEQGTKAGLDPVTLQESLTVTALNTAKNAGVDVDQVAQGVQVAQVDGDPNQQGGFFQTQTLVFMPFSFSSPPVPGGGDVFVPFIPVGTVFTYVVVVTTFTPSLGVVVEILSPKLVQQVLVRGDSTEVTVLVEKGSEGTLPDGSASQ